MPEGIRQRRSQILRIQRIFSLGLESSWRGGLEFFLGEVMLSGDEESFGDWGGVCGG